MAENEQMIDAAIKGMIEEMKGMMAKNSKEMKEEMKEEMKGMMANLAEEVAKSRRDFADYRTWTDTRFAEREMRTEMGGAVYTSPQRVPSGHGLIEARRDYRPIKSQGR